MGPAGPRRAGPRTTRRRSAPRAARARGSSLPSILVARTRWSVVSSGGPVTSAPVLAGPGGPKATRPKESQIREKNEGQGRGRIATSARVPTAHRPHQYPATSPTRGRTSNVTQPRGWSIARRAIGLPGEIGPISRLPLRISQQVVQLGAGLHPVEHVELRAPV